MKNVLFISMVAFSILVSGGCKKKEVDPCEGKTCLNGGNCVDGTCYCPVGFTGDNCGTQITPTKITIDTIKVVDFPSKNGSGNDWDSWPEEKPDIYVVLKDTTGGSSTELVNSKTNRISNANNTIHTLHVLPVDITNLVNQYYIELIDYDGLSANDPMGNFYFSIYNNTNKFPKKLKVQNSTGTLEFELSLSYTY